MIIWKAPIPETIVARCFRANCDILISRLPRSRSRTLYPRALPDRLSEVDAGGDLPRVRRFECRTSLRGRDSAFAPNRASARRGRKGAYTFARRRQNSYQIAGQGCIGFPVSDIQRALIDQPPTRSLKQSPSMEAFQRLSSRLGSAGSRTDRQQTPHWST